MDNFSFLHWIVVLFFVFALAYVAWRILLATKSRPDEIADTWKPRTAVFVILAVVVPLWILTLPLFLYLAYRSYVEGCSSVPSNVESATTHVLSNIDDTVKQTTAGTPIERVGILAIGLAGLLLIGIAVYWNIAEEWFVHRHQSKWLERVPMPSIEVAGGEWQEDASGWVLYERVCRNAAVKASPMGILTVGPLFECRMQFIPHIVHSDWTMQTSFAEYARALFRPDFGSYFPFTIIILLLLFLGILMRLGLVDKLSSWIKVGRLNE